MRDQQVKRALLGKRGGKQPIAKFARALLNGARGVRSGVRTQNTVTNADLTRNLARAARLVRGFRTQAVINRQGEKVAAPADKISREKQKGEAVGAARKSDRDTGAVRDHRREGAREILLKPGAERGRLRARSRCDSAQLPHGAEWSRARPRSAG